MGNRLYVANLSYQTSEAELEETFQRVGTVSSVQIVMDRETNRSRGFGFITMGTWIFAGLPAGASYLRPADYPVTLFPSGRTLGFYYFPVDDELPTATTEIHAYLWEPPVFTPLGKFPLNASQAGMEIRELGPGSYLGSYGQGMQVHLFTWIGGTAAMHTPPAGYTLTSRPRLTGTGYAAGEYSSVEAGMQGYLWKDGVFATISSSEVTSVTPKFLTDAGRVYGIGGGRLHTWADGALAELLPEGAMPGTASFGAYAQAFVAGTFLAADGKTHLFRWSPFGGFTTHRFPEGLAEIFVSAVSETGVVAGSYNAADGLHHAFVFSEGALTDIAPPAGYTELWPQQLCPTGRWLGIAYSTSGDWHAYTWAAGAGHILTPAGTFHEAAALNAAGAIAATYSDATGHMHAFVWKDSVATDVTPQVNTAATISLTDTGRILVVANSRAWTGDPGDPVTPTPTPTPTPAPALVLTVTGKPRITTTRRIATLRGRTTVPAAVQYRLARGKWQRAQGSLAWRCRVALEPGRNIVQIVATAADGQRATRRVIILRRERSR